MRSLDRDFNESARASKPEPAVPATGAVDDEKLLLDNRRLVLEGLFACATPLQVEAAAGFARYLSSTGITNGNCLLYTSPSPRDS